MFKKYNISTIPLVNKSLNSVIKLEKDVTQKCNHNINVYEFDCLNYPASYIDFIYYLLTRINEHKKSKYSVVHEYIVLNTDVISIGIMLK